jgi:hypothetical protein
MIAGSGSGTGFVDGIGAEIVDSGSVAAAAVGSAAKRLLLSKICN